MGSLGTGTGIALQPPGDAASSLPKNAAFFSAGQSLAAEAVATMRTAQLPNGATSIIETYGNWSVGCRLVDGQKQCLLEHVQSDSQIGKPPFAIGLQISRNGKTEGTMLMRLGLKLDAGVILAIDREDLGSALRFSSCMPQGCLLSVSFPAAAVDPMKKSRILTATSLTLDGGKVVSFKVPLEGSADAIVRINELGR